MNSMLLCILSRLTVLTYVSSSESGVILTNDHDCKINIFPTRNSDPERVHHKAKFSKAQNAILIFVKQHEGLLQV